MPIDSDLLQRIATPLHDAVNDYATLVKKLADSSAEALTFFGAVLSESFDPAAQTARNVLVVTKVDLGILRRLAEHGFKLGKAGIAAPLVMTPSYIKASLDTFPLELLEIQQQHIALFGQDFFSDLGFEKNHVRLQCERDLKAVLMGLRQGLLAAAGREGFVTAVAHDVGEGLIRTFRGLLWMEGDRDTRDIGAILDGAERIAKRKLPGVRAALDPKTNHGWAEFETLYQDVEALGEIADAW